MKNLLDRTVGMLGAGATTQEKVCVGWSYTESEAKDAAEGDFLDRIKTA